MSADDAMIAWREIPGWTEARHAALNSGLPPAEVENIGNTRVPSHGLSGRLSASMVIDMVAIFTKHRESGRGVTGAQRRRAERIVRRMAREMRKRFDPGTDLFKRVTR